MVSLKQPLVFVFLFIALFSNPVIDAMGQDVAPVQGRQRKQFNVLLIAVDDLRPMLGCYGATPIQSPHIDSLAKRAVVFTRAYCQIAKCGPSRLSMLTSLRPDTTRVYDHRRSDLKRYRNLNPQIASLPKHFRQQGYFTQSFGKIYHDGWDNPSDWSVPSSPGRPAEILETVDEKAIQKIPLAQRVDVPTIIRSRDDCPAIQSPDVPDQTLFAGRMTTEAITAIETKRGGPFFIAVGYRRPHLPLVAPKRYFDLYKLNANWLPANREPPLDAPIMAWFNSDVYAGFAKRVGFTMPIPPTSREQGMLYNGFELRSYRGIPYHGPIEDDLQLKVRQAYMACISYVDAQIGRLLAALRRQKLVEKTIVVFYSDHGWHLGEHASWGKMTNYEFDTRVPLIIAVPGFDAGRTESLTELIDIYPTLCEFSRLPIPMHVEGKSLVPIWSNPKAVINIAAYSQFTRFQKYMGRAVRTERYRYVRWSDRKSGQVVARELYDHKVDPAENRNIYEINENSDNIRRLDSLLDQ